MHDDVDAPDRAPHASTIDRRQMLKRIGVAGAIVWSAPLLSQAPAYAAGSYCSTSRVIAWNGFGANPVTFPRTLTFPEDVTVTITETFHGTTTSYGVAGDPDRSIYTTSHGGLPATSPNNYSGPLLLLWQTARTPGGRRLNFAFTNPSTGQPIAVQNVRFWITDIDYASGQYDDRVSLRNQSGGIFAHAEVGANNRIRGGGGTGTGTTDSATNAFYPNAEGNLAESSSQGTIRVEHAAPLTSFLLDFWCGSRSTSGQHAVFITNISFDSCT